MPDHAEVSAKSGIRDWQGIKSLLTRIGWFCIGWVSGLVGITVLLSSYDSRAAYVAFTPAIVFSGLLGCMAISVVLHECSHFIASCLLRLNPYHIELGQGAPICEGSLFGVTLTVRALPLAGYIKDWPVAGPLLWLRYLFVVAAGPGVNAAILAISAWLLYSPPETWSRHPSGERYLPFLILILMCNAYLLVVSLAPKYCRIDEKDCPNDGLQIFWLLKRTHPIFQLGREPVQPDTPVDPAKIWQAWQDASRRDVVLDEQRDLLCKRGLPRRVRMQLLDSYATGVLMFDASNRLDEADCYSEELLRAKPAEWTVKGTRGSVLIEMGRLDEGVAMLTEVFANDPSAFDRSIVAAYLSLAAIRRGDYKCASQWQAASRANDPHCIPLKRFERMLEELKALPPQTT